MSVRSTSSRKRTDRHLYSWFAIVAPLIIFAGFARTFYLQGLSSAPALSTLLLVHGIIMSLWFGLFIVQVRLVAAGRTDLHQRLGVAGAILVVVMLALGTYTAIDAARRGASPDPNMSPLMFMAIPLADLLVFGILVGVALWNRRRSDIHKRLMLLATVSILTPGIARIPLGFIRQGGVPMFLGLTVLCAVICIAVDTAKRRRLHPAFAWGGAFFLASLPLRMLLAGTEAWTKFATWLVG